MNSKNTKYQVWDATSETMHEVEALKFGINGNVCAITFDGIEVDAGMWKWFDKLHLRMSTGLYDKNGKEIYRGDIVDWKTPNYQRTFTVQWSKRKAGYNIKPKYLSEMEVIGNIYEHPNLLTTEE